MELNSLLILLEAAEYLERRDREAEHGYASVLPFASDFSRKKPRAAPLARRAPSSSHYLCCDGISGGTAVRRLCSFVCCSGSGCVRAGGCLTGTAPAPAWELLQPCALPALLRSSRAASVSRQCPAGPAWPHGSADGGSSRIA